MTTVAMETDGPPVAPATGGREGWGGGTAPRDLQGTGMEMWGAVGHWEVLWGSAIGQRYGAL